MTPSDTIKWKYIWLHPIPLHLTSDFCRCQKELTLLPFPLFPTTFYCERKHLDFPYNHQNTFIPMLRGIKRSWAWLRWIDFDFEDLFSWILIMIGSIKPFHFPVKHCIVVFNLYTHKTYTTSSSLPFSKVISFMLLPK